MKIERDVSSCADRSVPLTLVQDPVWGREATEELPCPHCWNLVDVWLAHPRGTAICWTCEGPDFPIARGDA